MKLRFIFHNLSKIVCAIVILNTKLTLSLSYHARRITDHQHTNHEYHQHQIHQHHEDNNLPIYEKFATTESDVNGIFNSNAEVNDPYSRHYNQHTYQPDHQHHSNDPHLMELAESANDPKNLRNGIYHDGAVTYDLGLPNYEILNPHDPPEIITSDHPQYEEQLNHIKKTNNFTIEDFGVTPMLDSDTFSETTSITTMPTTADVITTTETPETTTDEQFLAISTTTSESPIKNYKNMKSDIEKHLRKTKEKLRILNDEVVYPQNKNHKIPTTHTNNEAGMKVRKTNKLSKKQGPTTLITFSNSNKSNHSIPKHFTAKKLKGNSFQMQQPSVKILNGVLNNDLEYMNSFYGQSVLLPAEYVRPPNYSYRFGNAVSSQNHNDHQIAYSPYVSGSHLSLPSQYRLHRS